jgi:hypothetical protein
MCYLIWNMLIEVFRFVSYRFVFFFFFVFCFLDSVSDSVLVWFWTLILLPLYY